MRYLVTAHDMVGEYDSHKTDELLEALQWMGDYRRKGKDVEMQTDDADEGDRGLTFLEMEALLASNYGKDIDADVLVLIAAVEASKPSDLWLENDRALKQLTIDVAAIDAEMTRRGL